MTLQLDEIFRLSPNAYMVLDRDLRYVAANEAYLKATASKLEDLLGKNLFDLFPNDPNDPNNESRQMLRRSLERVVSTGESDVLAFIPYRVPKETPQGVVTELRYWSATHTPLRGSDGGVAHILQHTIDVTELRRSRESAEQGGGAVAMEGGVLERAQRLQDTNRLLEDERRRLLALFDQAPSFMAFMRGSDHVIEIANQAYLQISGHRPVLGRTLRQAFPEIEGQGFFELLDQVFETGVPFVGRGAKALLQRAAGGELEEVFVDFIYQPITGADGKVIGVFTQGHDVTEQKKAEAQIRKLNEELEHRVSARTDELRDANRELESFSYSVSHDLRAPLRHIAAFAQLLQGHAAASLDEVGRDYLKTIADAAKEGGKLVDDLLHFSRMGRAELARAPVAVDVLIGEVRAELATEAAGRDIDWRIGALPSLTADPSLLRSVMKNLLSNAIKYTRPRPQAIIEIGGERRDDEIHYWVKDNGVGFDMAHVDKLFGVFQRLHSVETFEGTGIGLANVRRIVMRHGGRVWAEGKPDDGATFHFTLPAA